MADAPTTLRRLYPVGCYYKLKHFDHLDFSGARVGCQGKSGLCAVSLAAALVSGRKGRRMMRTATVGDTLNSVCKIRTDGVCGFGKTIDSYSGCSSLK